MQKIGLLVTILALISPVHSWAEDKPAPEVKPIEFKTDIKKQSRAAAPIKMKKAIDATSLLSDTGEIYSLTGLDIPADNETAPKAQKRLAELVEGKKCTLYQTRSEKVGRVNRMNQILAQITCGKDDAWIQGTLLAEGLARVRTTPENKNNAADMLALEQTARDKKLGLWALPMNAVFTPVTADAHINSFGVVEGRIYQTAQNKTAIFLNFTSDWKTDFSIGIPATLRKDFSKLRIDPLSLKGKTIRVRGWIRNYNGPYIELDHVEQLEIIAAKDKSAPPVEETKTPEKQMQDKAMNIIESILDDATKPKKPAAHKEFMHTIGGDTPKPVIEEPAPPAVKVPVVEKPVVQPVKRTPNQ